MTYRLLGAAAVAAVMATPSAAAVMVEVVRTTDTLATFNFAGTLDADPAPNAELIIVELLVPVINADGFFEPVLGGLTDNSVALGDAVLLSAELELSFSTLSLNFNNNLSEDAVASGSVIISLAQGAFADVGTEGEVETRDLSNLGTATIVAPDAAIPLPAPAFLLLSAIAGLAALRGRR